MGTFLFSTALFLAQSASAFHVVVDPGHGGVDRGASRNHVSEAEITLAVAKALASRLKSDGFKVSLTRTSDEFISLEHRADLANEKGANLFLSIHVNSSPDPKARGQEIYFQNQLPPDQESMFLASRENENKKLEDSPRAVSLATKNLSLSPDVRAIIEDLERNHNLRLSGLFTKEIFRNWRGDRMHRKSTVRQAPFFVISNVNAPAVLIEIGYLTNDQESKRLTDPKYQEEIAEGLRVAVTRFKEVVDNRIGNGLN